MRKLVTEYNKALIEALQNTKNWTQALPSCPNGPTMRDVHRQHGKLNYWAHSLTTSARDILKSISPGLQKSWVLIVCLLLQHLKILEINFWILETCRNKKEILHNECKIIRTFYWGPLHLKCETSVCFTQWIS